VDPFLSEIRLFSINYPPKGWALCNGQTLPINQNQALFSLLGTTYGGNGQTTFQLPDLRGRVPIHFGSGFSLGQTGGQEAHTVTAAEMPQHTHALAAGTEVGTLIVPGGSLLARTPSNPYADPGNLAVMSAGTVTTVGGSQPHENRQPYLTLTFCIALVGIFPSQT